jgi:hypothetical protein
MQIPRGEVEQPLAQRLKKSRCYKINGDASCVRDALLARNKNIGENIFSGAPIAGHSAFCLQYRFLLGISQPFGTITLEGAHNARQFEMREELPAHAAYGPEKQPHAFGRQNVENKRHNEVRASAQRVNEPCRHSRRRINDHAVEIFLHRGTVQDAGEIVADVVRAVPDEPFQQKPRFEIPKGVIAIN